MSLLACAALAAVVASGARAQSLALTVAAPDGAPLATDLYVPIGHGLGPWPVVRVPQRRLYGTR
jgi:predicted acyl esterase